MPFLASWVGCIHSPYLVIEGVHHAVLFTSAQQLGQQLMPEVQIDKSRTAQLRLPWLPRAQGTHGFCKSPEEHREGLQWRSWSKSLVCVQVYILGISRMGKGNPLK